MAAADPVVAPPRPRAPQRPRLRPAPPPRRVSGPARSRTTRAAAAAPAAPARAPRTRRASAGAISLPAPSLPLDRVLDGLRNLPDARWLDRLLRGQGWIVLIGIALMGIVAMQVSLLKMNAGIGQSIERAGSLERQNADLRAEVSRLSSEERIATVAAQNGLVMPDAGEVRYVRTRGDLDARKAASVMRAPDPADDATLAATGATTSTATASTTAAPTTTTAPTTSTTDPTTPTASATPPADATAPTTPTEPTTSATAPTAGTTAGATQAPAGTTAAPGQ